MHHCALAILLFVPVMMIAQTRPPAVAVLPNSDKLITLHVRGSTRFTPQEVAAAIGLTPGVGITQKVMNDAGQRLADTGAFKELSFSFTTEPKGATVEFEVTDAPQFVPARFDNLVWFTDQELVAKVREQVPLFKGELPLTGNLADRVKEVLQKLLAARGVQAKVSHMPEAALNQPIRSLTYRVEGLPIRIRQVNFPGADQSFTPLLQSASAALTSDDYSRARSTIFAEMSLLPIYLERGSLKAAFAAPAVQVVQTTPELATVDLTLPVVQGVQYRAAGITFEGNTVLSTAELRARLHLSPGKPVNAVELQDDLRKFTKPYGTKGFMTARVQARATFDDAHASVSYTFEVSEGPVYHFRKLDIQGLDQETAARLARDWKLRPGDPFDNSYPQTFLQSVSRQLPRRVRWTTSENISLDPQRKTVDVMLRFSAGTQVLGQ